MAQSGLTKAELRRLTPPLADDGAAAQSVISSWEANGWPESVFCYISGIDECSTIPILCTCLKRGIPLAVPLCGANGVMTARRITGFSELRRGRFGLWEPPGEAEIVNNPAVVIVPGIAFDRDGFRLGRGGGYYDRWLSGKRCRTIGLCRPERLLERLPRDAWDVPIDEVVTLKTGFLLGEGGYNAGGRVQQGRV